MRQNNMYNIPYFLENWCSKEGLSVKENFSYLYTRETANFIAIVGTLYVNLPKLNVVGSIYENIPQHRIAESFLIDTMNDLNLVYSEVHAILWLLENLEPSKYTVEQLYRTLCNWDIFGNLEDEYVKDWLRWLVDVTTMSQKWYDVLTYAPSNKQKIKTLADQRSIEHKIENKTIPRLYINIGASGSGKSTSSNALLNSDPTIFYYSRDDLLLKHFKDKFPEITDPFELYSACWKASTENKQFDKDVFALFQQLIADRRSIIVDNTNVNVTTRAKFIDEANKAGYLVVAVMHPITLRELLKRRKLRPDKTVPFSAVASQYGRIEQPWPNIEVECITNCFEVDTLTK